MAQRTWRQIAEPIIRQVLSDHYDCDEPTIKKALHEAYPFGARTYHPYKIWLNEIKRQRGKKNLNKPTTQLNLFN